MKTKFGLAVRDAFWKVAKGRSVLDFNDSLKELCDLKPSAARYLAIDPALYSVSQFPGPRFGSTSNIVESANRGV